MIRHVGILHPGEMGSFIAATVRNTLGEVFWCSAGRSAKTKERAQQQQLTDIPDFDAFCQHCDLIISLCPPHAATDLANDIINAGFKGLYLDANAISPDNAKQMGKQLQQAGIQFIDGGVVGLPSYQSGTTWLYLSGEHANIIAPCFKAGPAEVTILGDQWGEASALKMCFAAWNKGKTALLTAVMAAADDLQVLDALQQQWDIFEPGVSAQGSERIRKVARKAWRFGGEMDEIAETLRQCNVPEDFFTAAAETYRRQSVFKDSESPPELAHVLAKVRKGKLQSE